MAKKPTKLKGGKAEFPVGGRGLEADLDNAMSEPRTEDDGGDPEREEIIPEGYESEQEFIAEALREYTLDYDADRHNIEQAAEDLRFIYVDQWDEETRKDREAQGRPCLTINTLPQFIGQVVGDRRINKTQIKVIPDKQGNVKGAEVRSGLIKSIENYSRAERVYDQCCEDQVGCGISNFEITMEYATNDAFDQDIFIRTLSNPFAVVWDRFSKDPTGKDARRCFVEEVMSRNEYKDIWPEMPIPSSFPGDFDGVNFGMWVEADDVKIVAYWKMIEKPATFALMADGQVEDVTGVPREQYAHRLYVDPIKNEAYIREGTRTYAQRWLITSFAILEGPYELPLSRLPIIKVSGRIGRVGLKQYRFGLVRWARDPSLLRNYWRSTAAEWLAMAPKAQWIADHASVKGREDDFRDAHLTGDPLLVFNTGKNKPERVTQPEIPAAMLNEANMNSQDIKDVTGLHDASLGIRSNEVSGKAIMARQREGDVATVTYHDHLNEAIQEGGCVINDLIPICYDTTRIIRVVGIDDAKEFIKINDPLDEASPDLTMGKYDTEIITGPSYTTQRMESAELLLELAKVNPALFEIAGDIIMETQDIPGGERIANRLKKALPAAQQEEQDKKQAEAEASGQPVEPTAEEQQAQQMQEMQAQIAQAQIQMQMQEMQLKLQEQEAKTAQAAANAKAAEAQARAAEAQARKAQADADKAEAEAVMTAREIQFHRAERAIEVHQKANPPEPTGDSKNRAGGSRTAGGSRPKKGTRK